MAADDAKLSEKLRLTANRDDSGATFRPSKRYQRKAGYGVLFPGTNGEIRPSMAVSGSNLTILAFFGCV